MGALISFQTSIKIVNKLGLSLNKIIAILVAAAGVGLALLTYWVNKQFGPLTATCVTMSAILLIIKRLRESPAIGTPPLPEELQLKKPELRAAGKAVRVVVVSDTHNQLLDASQADSIPDGDIFIHAGDICKHGTFAELRAFNSFLGLLPHKVKIVIAGNHTLVMDPETYAANVARIHSASERALHDVDAHSLMSVAEHKKKIRHEYLTNATHYLEGETVEIAVPLQNGSTATVTVTGAPWTDPIPGASAQAFARSHDEQLTLLNKSLAAYDPATQRPTGKHYKSCDILVTHGPPLNVNDRTFFGRRVGSSALGKFLVKLAKDGHAPPFNVFGHIHEARGATRGVTAARLLGFEKSSKLLKNADGDGTVLPTTFINAASVNLFHSLRKSPENDGFAVVFDLDADKLMAAAAATAEKAKAKMKQKN